MGLAPRKQPILKSVGDDSGTVHNRVYYALRHELMTGRLKPGQVVSLRYLVKRFSISTTPARQAIQRLQAERALVVGANRVPTVPTLTGDDLRTLRDIRVALEGYATQRAVGQISPEELRQIEMYYNDMHRAIRNNNFGDYLMNNWSFHHTIYQSARSDFMLGLIETLWMRAGPSLWLVLPGKGHMENSMGHHTHALEAIKHGDAVAVRVAIEADICGAMASLERLLSKE